MDAVCLLSGVLLIRIGSSLFGLWAEERVIWIPSACRRALEEIPHAAQGEVKLYFVASI